MDIVEEEAVAVVIKNKLHKARVSGATRFTACEDLKTHA